MKRIELFINLKYFDDKDFENFYLYLKSPVFGSKTGVLEVYQNHCVKKTPPCYTELRQDKEYNTKEKKTE